MPFFAKLHAHMGNTPGEPLTFLDALMRLVRFANLRRDGLFGVPYYLSQFFLLTDFHVVAVHGEAGSAATAHSSAAGWTPSDKSKRSLRWRLSLTTSRIGVLPVVADMPEKCVTARALGHPLLADDVGVPNDVDVGPPGSFVLVTGSNMSGKSTLLRAVGLNVTLAQAGGPVCRPASSACRPSSWQPACEFATRSPTASRSSWPSCAASRKSSTSRAIAPPTTRGCLLYLLDEILQGTNSVERHIAVARVIGRLVESGSIGMVSTHDLELANSPKLSQACRVVHFRESFTGSDGQQQMTFDYLLRPGLSPTTNALKLLDFVGLND